MKKITLLLAALMLFSLLAGCNTEKTPDHTIPGYDINLYTGEGWTVAEESKYDLQLSKDGVTLYAMGFAPIDFLDMPTMEELYLDCNDRFFSEKTDKTVKEAEKSYEVDGNKFVTTLFTAKDGDKEMEYLCFGILCDDEAGSVVWLCFGANAKTMKSQKKALKKIADKTDANGEYFTQEDLDQQIEELLSQEEEAYGNVQTETEPAETEAAQGTEPTGTTEATGATEATGSTEATEAAGATEPTGTTEPAATVDPTASTETTVAATE